ncbi:MAG: hypothetical protein Q9227_007016 [Pyrenula ochraceoflavens]
MNQQPLSPPQSNDGDFQNIQLLAQHNAAVDAHPSPLYTSSTPGMEHMDPYGDPTHYQQAYQPANPTFVRSYHPNTPPGSAGYEEVMRTRSGRTLGSPLSPNTESSRASRSPRPRRTRPSRAGKAKNGVNIDKPLSELTKDYTLPIKDMEAWVNRPAEVRRKEVEKKNGYVARPMNSFMLYRSAYAERVKQYCKENNHQVVSQVSGASWPLEPKEIRDLYEKFATLERDNHQKAHPDYKFAPNKNANAKKRKNYDSDDDFSDLDDPEFTMGYSRSGSAKRNRAPRQSTNDRSYQSTPFEPQKQAPHPLAHLQSPHESSWEANNQGRPPMQMFGTSALPGQYYQQMIDPYGPGIEDVRYQRLDGSMPQQYLSPGFGAQTPPLVGLPGGEHELLQPQPQIPVSLPADGPLDPRLLQFDPHQYGQFEAADPGYSVSQNYQYESAHHMPASDQQYLQASLHPGDQTLPGMSETWDEFQPNGMPSANEFDEQLRHAWE